MSENQKSSTKIILYQIVRFIQSVKDNKNANSINEACRLLGDAFDFDLSSSENFHNLSYYPNDLSEIFDAGVSSLGIKTYDENLESVQHENKYDAFIQAISSKGYFAGVEKDSVEYLERNAKAIQKFKTKLAPSPTSTTIQLSKAEKEKKADEKKNEGNAAIQVKDYEKAVRLYSEGLELSSDGPSSHIYFSNRAAAHCYLGNYTQAVNDCNASIKLDPTYVKAYSRLGLAHFNLEQFDEALLAYTKASELESSNNSHRDSIRLTKQKIADKNKSSITNTDTSSSGSGGPDLSQLFGGAGGAGGAGGLAGLMQNPAMMKMAQQMMSNPAMMQQAMSMLGGAGGGAGGGSGGMPDFSALASMMGGAGGGPPASGGIPPFSGFVDEPEPVSTPSRSNPSVASNSPQSEMMNKLQNSPAFQQMQSDPAMASVMSKINAGDMQGAMREAQGNPALMKRIMDAMSNL